MVSVNATAAGYSYPGRTADTATPLERSRRLNTALLVIIVILLLFGALGGTYLYSVVTGLSAAAGANGADGLPGSNGAPGPSGSDGSSGPIGSSGADGDDGRNGSDGQDGVDGAAGADGLDGQPGADGVTLYNSGQGVVDLGVCDSDVRIKLQSRLEGDSFYLSTITLSGISSECQGATIDLFALGGTSPNWVTLSEAIGVDITGESVVVDSGQLSDESVLSSTITKIALEIR